MALTEIDGDASGDVRDAVLEALEGKELALISGKEVNRAVHKLGDLADLTEKGFKKLATELEADAIVVGKLDKVGRSKTLKFRLYIHRKMAKGFTVSFKNARSEKFRSLLHAKVLDKIGVSASGDGDDEKPARKKPAGDDDEDPLATQKDKKDKKPKKARNDDEDETRPRKAQADDDDARPKKARGDDEDETRPKRARGDDEDETRPRKANADDDDDDDADDDDADADAKRADPDDDGEPRRARKKVAAADDGDGDDAEGIATTVEVPRAANRVAVRLDVGVSVLQRSFTFNARVFDNRPKGPSLKPVPGARFEAELYPLAFSNPKSPAAGLGIGVEYDKTLTLNLSSSIETNVAVPVKQSHYSIGARYRLAFGKTATSPTLTLGAGYGKRLFAPDGSKLTMDAAKAGILRDTPATAYTVLDPGLTFRLPVTRMVAFSLGSRGMLITDAGPIQRATSYGRTKVYGVEAGASLDVVLGNRFALRFAGELVQIGFQFTGAGALSNNLDGDPTTMDVGGLADRSIGGSATLAVMY